MKVRLPKFHQNVSGTTTSSNWRCLCSKKVKKSITR